MDLIETLWLRGPATPFFYTSSPISAEIFREAAKGHLTIG